MVCVLKTTRVEFKSHLQTHEACYDFSNVWISIVRVPEMFRACFDYMIDNLLSNNILSWKLYIHVLTSELYVNNWNTNSGGGIEARQFYFFVCYEKKYLTLNDVLYMKLKLLKSSIYCVIIKTVAQKEIC